MATSSPPHNSILATRILKKDLEAKAHAAKAAQKARKAKEDLKSQQNINTLPHLRLNAVPPVPKKCVLDPPSVEVVANLPYGVLENDKLEGWCSYKEKVFFVEWGPGVIGMVNLELGYKKNLERLAVKAALAKDLMHVRIDGNFTEISPLEEYAGWRFEEHFPVSFLEIERMAMVYVKWTRQEDRCRAPSIWRRGDLPAIVLI